MSKDITVGSCIECPMRKYRAASNSDRGGGYCSADLDQRRVAGDMYSKRQPAPPDWCPAREGIAIRFVKPSSLGKIVTARATRPPKPLTEHPDPWADDDVWIGFFDQDIPF